MPAQANANVIALQLEKVRDKVPLLYERDDILLTMIQQRGDIEKISSRNMRLPLQVNPGGKAGSYNADGGDLGRGAGTQYDVAQVSPIFFRFAIEITKLVEYATTGRERAVENAAKREVANGMKQFRAFLDKLIQTAGNGAGNDQFRGRQRADDECAEWRGAGVRGPDNPGVRHNADDEPRNMPGGGGGSDQPDTDDHRGRAAGRDGGDGCDCA
jgi:hypothetical protein